MNHEQQSGNPDEVWQQFSQAEAQAAENLVEAYALIEGYNAKLLNQVSGLEDPDLTLVEPLTPGAEEAPKLGPPTMVKLFMRPDIQDALHEQHESSGVLYEKGDPYVVVGEVPAETKAMMARMLSAANADLDAAHSTQGLTIWRGDIAGQPIRFEMSTRTMTSYVPEGEKSTTVRSMIAVREQSSNTEQ